MSDSLDVATGGAMEKTKMQLAEKVQQQRTAAEKHRLEMGLGPYEPITGTQVLRGTVTYRADSGEMQTVEDCILHVDKHMAVIYRPNDPRGKGIIRKLGTFVFNYPSTGVR